MEEISTSFCFICLLHLANEQGLKLQSASSSVPDSDGGNDGDDETEEQAVDRVADIWSLKVCIPRPMLYLLLVLTLILLGLQRSERYTSRMTSP